jgi:DNA-binding LytR/AlgR family response regulator
MIRAIAVDDEPLALDVIKAYCAKVDYIDLQKTFTSPTEAIRHLKRFPVDLIFLDIRMPSMSGMDLLKAIHQHVMVIFTTAHAEFAVESYELNAIDYLLKPIEESRFQQAVGRAKDFFDTQHLKSSDSEHDKSIFIRADYSLVKVSLPEVLYIEGLGDYLKIHLPEKKPVVVRMTMKNMLEKLPVKDFIRVHRSFIIPLSRIEHIRNKLVQVAGVQIPIGASFEEAFMERMSHR